MGYLRDHWSGGHSLARAFWINFALPFLLVAGLLRLLRPPWIEDVPVFLALAGAYVAGYCLLVYPWQIVGLVRACDRHLEAYDERGRVAAVHGAIFLSLLATMVALFAIVQNGIQLAASRTAPPETRGYALRVLDGGRLIGIEGSFDPGISRDLRQLLARHHDVTGLLLESDGGNIYEARGVAKLVAERALTTRVESVCKSACTTAFIGGIRRTLVDDAQLGFHAYRLQAQQPWIDVAAEQEKDRAFYRAQGVAPAFLARIFDAPHESIWYPPAGELLRAKVVHRIEASGPAPGEADAGKATGPGYGGQAR